MNTITVRLLGGPADGTTRQLPAGPDGEPPARWILTSRDPGAVPAELDHLYQREPEPGPNGTWTMHWVRSDPVGMTE